MLQLDHMCMEHINPVVSGETVLDQSGCSSVRLTSAHSVECVTDGSAPLLSSPRQDITPISNTQQDFSRREFRVLERVVVQPYKDVSAKRFIAHCLQHE